MCLLSYSMLIMLITKSEVILSNKVLFTPYLTNVCLLSGNVSIRQTFGRQKAHFFKRKK